jgi:hypothetical protein
MNDDPKCDKCGAPITTAMMAAICPHRERCEFWPDDAESQAFLDSLGWRYKPTDGAAGMDTKGTRPSNV